MPTEIIWTALPRGRSRTTLNLSVHVSPRLTADGGTGTLDPDFPAFVAWPPPELAFEVRFGGLPPVPASVVSTPDPALWPVLFPPSSGVVSYTYPDRKDSPIHSYPLTKIAKFLQDQYATIAIDSPEQFPAITTLLANGFEDIRFSGRDGAEKWNETNAWLRGVLADNKVVDTRSSSTTTQDFVQLEDFFAPSDVDDPDVLAALESPVSQPTLDFHAAVQFLNQHPPLMWLFGLTFDLEVELARFDEIASPHPSGPTTVSVEPVSDALDGVSHRLPLTHCDVGTEFIARPGPDGAHLTGHFLRFDDTAQYQTVQVEADGGGLKAVDLAGNLGTKLLKVTADTPSDSAVPTLRADGFAVARLGSAQELQDTMVKQAAQNDDLTGGTLQLWAEDLARGVRVDVWDSRSAGWHSLMRRQVTYEVGGQVQPTVEDEGFIGTAATKKVQSDDLYLPEEVFAWDGWSLVAPRPGQTLNPDPAAPPLMDRPANNPGPDFDGRIHAEHAPVSLPMLRHGVDYRFRARTVDLAGNSLPHSTADDTHATPPRTFGRFEPPQTPPVLLRTPRGPGESMETVALRSNYDADPAPATAERHLAPAKVGVTAVEHWGSLEVPDPGDPSRLVVDKAAYATLAARDAATLLNHADGAGDPKDPSDTRYYDVGELAVTWSPDPAVPTFAFRLLDGAHQGFLEIYPFRDPSPVGAWHDARGIRLVLEQGAGLPSIDLDERVLTVPLDKADVVRARLSPVLDVAELDRFGLWHWVLDALPAGPAGEAKRTELIGLIRTGQHWMFEPYRILTLVHAVRQPLLAPQFVPPLSSIKTALGNTWTRVTRELTFSRKSTSRVDVLASWQEPVDGGPGAASPADAGQPGSLTIDRQTAFTVATTHDDGDDPLTETLFHRHEFGDTKHRLVTYRAVATTRFAEFFTSRAEVSFGGASTVLLLDTGNPAQGVVPGSVKITRTLPTGLTAPLVEGTHFTVDSLAGSVAFGDGTTGELPDAGDPIVVTYLAPPVTRETPDPPAAGEVGPQLVNVVSSAPPAAPKIVYAVPTFGWEAGEVVQGGDVVGVTSTRRGGGLRIYLERPWWSSGQGELLGVLTWPVAEQANPPDLENPADPSVDADPRRPFVTQWGEDPAYGSGLLPHRYPRLSTFTSAASTHSGVGGLALTLGELGHDPDHRVFVAAHEVVYDPSRDLFACDVTMAAGNAYLPFVRLALARFQPSSMAKAHLSQVVLADFVQLAPDRAATVVFTGQTSVAVTLAGISHLRTEGTHGEVFPGEAFVTVEAHQPGAGGLLEWLPVGEPVQMSATTSGSTAEWTATLTLPGPRTPGMFRLVIDQFERLGWEVFNKDQLANPFIVGSSDLRLVHTDVIPID